MGNRVLIFRLCTKYYKIKRALRAHAIKMGRLYSVWRNKDNDIVILTYMPKIGTRSIVVKFSAFVLQFLKIDQKGGGGW